MADQTQIKSQSAIGDFSFGLGLGPEVFVVGDEHGWTINFDYKLWAADKDFRVGDKLGNLSHHCLFLSFFVF